MVDHVDCGVLCLFHVFCILLDDLSSFAIILIGKRELVAILCLYSCCLVTVIYVAVPHDTVGLVGPQCVIVVCPDHTHSLFS